MTPEQEERLVQAIEDIAYALEELMALAKGELDSE